jgi:hypothetical protein
MSSISLHDDTGKRLLHVGCVDIHTGAAWRVLKERIAAEHGIPEAEIEDAIRIEEDEDGVEVCTVDGVRVGFVATLIDGHEFGRPAEIAEAAE